MPQQKLRLQILLQSLQAAPPSRRHQNPRRFQVASPDWRLDLHWYFYHSVGLFLFTMLWNRYRLLITAVSVIDCYQLIENVFSFKFDNRCSWNFDAHLLFMVLDCLKFLTLLLRYSGSEKWKPWKCFFFLVFSPYLNKTEMSHCFILKFANDYLSRCFEELCCLYETTAYFLRIWYQKAQLWFLLK